MQKVVINSYLCFCRGATPPVSPLKPTYNTMHPDKDQAPPVDLLPRPFKIVGGAICLLAVVVPIITGYVQQQSWQETSLRRHIATLVFLFGLLIIALCRQKMETMQTLRHRVQAFLFSLKVFMLAVGYLIITAKRQSACADAYSAFIVVVLVYIGVFYLKEWQSASDGARHKDADTLH